MKQQESDSTDWFALENAQFSQVETVGRAPPNSDPDSMWLYKLWFYILLATRPLGFICDNQMM